MFSLLRRSVYIGLVSLLSFFLLDCGRGLSSNTASSNPGSTVTPSSSQPGTGSGSGSGSSSGGSGTGSSGAQQSQYIYIGDPTNLQIDGFKLNSDGTLSAVPGSPFQMSGQGQAFQSAGDTLAVVGQFLFTDSTSGPSGLAAFKIDPATGTLTAINTSSSTTGTWFVLAGNSQANVLYTSGSVNTSSNGTSSSTNGLAAYAVNSDGTLRAVSTIISPVTPQNQQILAGAIAADRQGRFLYSWTEGSIHVFGLNSDGSIGSQVSGSPFAISTAYQPTSPSDPNACFGADQKPVLTSDPAGGRFLYASCDANAQVDEISVSSSGQLGLIGTVPSPGSGTELSSLTMSNDGAFVYGTEEEANSVVSFAVDQSSGKLTLAGTVAAGMRPNQAAVDVSNHFLYATNGSSNVSKNDFYPGSNNVSEYAVSKGVMTPLPDSPKTVGTRPASIVSVAF